MQSLPKNHRVEEGRHGQFIINEVDFYIGGSIIRYGEYCPKECQDLCRLTPEGGVVLEVGANYGTLTVPLAKKVGPSGRVYAMEPQMAAFYAMCGTLALNELYHVEAMREAAGRQAGTLFVPRTDPEALRARFDRGGLYNSGGERLKQDASGPVPVDEIPVRTIDSFSLTRLDLLKIDVEGMELDVLAGARETLKAFTPVISIENNNPDTSPALIETLNTAGYTCFWHAALLYDRNNFRRERENIFGNTMTLNMICVPKTHEAFIQGLDVARASSRHPFDKSGRKPMPSS